MTKLTKAESRFVGDILGRNYEGISHARTLGAFLAGLAAGVLGLTGIFGALFFLACSALISFFTLSIACRNDVSRYFPGGSKELFSFSQLMDGAMTYVLVWTVAYDAIYIF